MRADLDRLASLAVPAALAIEHSRLYEELRQRVRELEATQAQLLQAGSSPPWDSWSPVWRTS